MELFFYILFAGLFAYIAYSMAEKRGRNALGYAISAILFPPFLVWILLWLLGDLVKEDETVAEVVAETIENNNEGDN